MISLASPTSSTSKKEQHTMAEHNERGRWGEQKAAEYLERKGFRILWRDWRDGHRDLDIVAVDADQLVVVEVKTRKNADFTAPEMAVDARKQRNLAIAADKLAKAYGIEFPLRFDIVAVTGTCDADCRINHIEDAFIPF